MSVWRKGHYYSTSSDQHQHNITPTKSKSLTSPTPADEPQVVKLGDLVLHDSGAVPQFC